MHLRQAGSPEFTFRPLLHGSCSHLQAVINLRRILGGMLAKSPPGVLKALQKYNATVAIDWEEPEHNGPAAVRVPQGPVHLRRPALLDGAGRGRARHSFHCVLGGRGEPPVPRL